MISDIKPKIAVTMHGSDKQKQQFELKVKEGWPQTAVIIMQSFKAKTVTL